MTARAVSTSEVAVTIMKADPGVSEDQAFEIAGELDSHDSWYAGRDGQVEVAQATEMDKERICRTVSDMIDTPNKASVQSSLMTLLLDRSIPPAPGQFPEDGVKDASPEIQQASFLPIGMLATQLEKISQSPLVDAELRHQIQTIVQIGQRYAVQGDVAKTIVQDQTFAQLYHSDPEFKRVAREVVTARDWSMGLPQRLQGGVLMQSDARMIKETFESTSQYDQMMSGAQAEAKLAQELRQAQVTISGVAPSYSSDALRQIRSLGVAFRQSSSAVGRAGANVRGAGVAVSQSAGPVPNPFAKSVAIAAGATLVVAGAALGLAYYFGRDDSASERAGVRIASPSSPAAGPQGTVTVLDEITIEAEPVFQLDDLPPAHAEGTRASGPKK